MHSRRNFTKLAVTGLPLASLASSLAWGAKINSTVKGVRLGTITYSFRDFPRVPGKDNADVIIQALTECGIGEIELFCPNIEPGRTPGMAPEMAREELRRWRLATPMEYFKGMRINSMMPASIFTPIP